MYTRVFLSKASSSYRQEDQAEAYRDKLHSSNKEISNPSFTGHLTNHKLKSATTDKLLQDFSKTKKAYKHITKNHKEDIEHLLNVFYDEIFDASFEIKGTSPHSRLDVFLPDFSYKIDKKNIDNIMFDRFLNSSLLIYPALNLLHSALNTDIYNLKQIINRNFFQKNTFFYLLRTIDTNNEYQMRNNQGVFLCESYIFFVKIYLGLKQNSHSTNSLLKSAKEESESNQIDEKSNTNRSSFLNILKAYDELIEQDFTYVLYLLKNWTAKTNKSIESYNINLFLSTGKKLSNEAYFYKKTFYSFNHILSHPNDMKFIQIGESICLIRKNEVVDMNKVEKKILDGLECLKTIHDYLENFHARTEEKDLKCSCALQVLSDNIYFQNLKSPEKSLLMKKIAYLFSDRFNE